jgi:hypothetical protein
VELTELYADPEGETHFRHIEIDLETRDFAPPSEPIQISPEMPASTSLFLVAPPGWDKDFHPTPRKQLAIMLDGKATVQASDGEIVNFNSGAIVLLNDESSKGHLTQIQGTRNATVLLVGLAD